MEYRQQGEENYLPIAGSEVAGLPAGVYEVRVKATDTVLASLPSTVVIEKSVAVPAANTGLKYNGSEQTGVEEAAGYTLTGHTATNAGSYTAVAVLDAGYRWNDGTAEAKSIAWEIARADGPAAPAGLSSAAPTVYGGSDGSISGVNSSMEYADNADFANAKDCPDNTITGLMAGVYYVRIRETSNVEAGMATPLLLHAAEKMILPAALQVIDEEAFAGSTAEEIVLGDQVERIGARAFSNCSALALITLPHDVQIEEDAFSGCDRLTILCTEGSTAQAYAAAHEIPCLVLMPVLPE